MTGAVLGRAAINLLTALYSTTILRAMKTLNTEVPSPRGQAAFVSVPIDVSIYNEFVIRRGTPHVDVAAWIENIVQDYLDRTADDGTWSEQYYEWRSSTKDLAAFAEQYGDPAKGYHWATLFLPNGTKISMNYKGRQHNAEVRHEQIHYDGKTFSPSDLARAIANNTSRNAWRDLMIKRPSDQEPQLADTMRRNSRG